MYLLCLETIADGFTSVSRYSRGVCTSIIHLRAAEEDSAEKMQEFLEMFRATGNTS